MVKLQEIQDLYDEIKNIDTEPSAQTLIDLSEALGKRRMKARIMNIILNRFGSPSN